MHVWDATTRNAGLGCAACRPEYHGPPQVRSVYSPAVPAWLLQLQILRGTYAPLPEQYSPELHALVATLLRRKPEQRPSIDEVSHEGQEGS